MATKYTLVQHSGYLYGQKPEFANAVEVSHVSRVSDEQRISKAGGILLESYQDAEKREEEENYPPSVIGLVPAAKGTFSDRRHNGAPIYVPAKKESDADSTD